MANSLNEQKIIDTNKRALIKNVLVSDGTAVANASLIDVSSLAQVSNANAAHHKVTIKRIFGQAKSNGYITLQWAMNGSNDKIVTISTGAFDYNFESMGDNAVIKSPWSGNTNCSGDIIYSAVNLVPADVFTVFVDLRKNSEDYDAGQTADPDAFNQ